MTPTAVLTTSVGVFISILLGGGLAKAGFSSNSGHDERVAGATSAQPVVDDCTNDERNIA